MRVCFLWGLAVGITFTTESVHAQLADGRHAPWWLWLACLVLAFPSWVIKGNYERSQRGIKTASTSK